MNSEVLSSLLQELTETRKSFDNAAKSFRWNRINTIIMYSLISVVCVMLVAGGFYYIDERREDCERDNRVLVSISESQVSNASSIGIALATVSGADQSRFEEYMEVYTKEKGKQSLPLREC